MATLTRSAKTPATHRDLEPHWQHTGSELGLSRDALDQLRGPTAIGLLVPGRVRLLDALTKFDATFPARGARAVALEHCAGLPIKDALETLTGLRDRGEILLLQDGPARRGSIAAANVRPSGSHGGSLPARSRRCRQRPWPSTPTGLTPSCASAADGLLTSNGTR